MIPRFYFYRAEESGLSVIGIVCLTTWLPNPVRAIQEAKASAATKLGKALADVRLDAFHRL